MRTRPSIVLAGLLLAAACLATACRSTEDTSDEVAPFRARSDAGGARRGEVPGTADAGGALGLNDVSILWPAPATGELPAGYLKIFPGPGERGPGFPASAKEVLPKLHGDVPGGGNSTLEATKFDALVADLEAWRARSPEPTGGRLRVHPGLAKAGIDSTFARDLHDIVVRYATEAALVRFTTNSFAFDDWAFSQFDRKGLDDPNGTLTPEPEKSIGALLKTNALAGGTTAPAILAARDAVLANEHPAKTNAAKSDCGSCHLSDAAHRWAAKRGVSFDTPDRYEPPARIDVAIDVAPEVDGNASNTIAFGWHRIRLGKLVPSISARVAAESADMVASLQARR